MTVLRVITLILDVLIIGIMVCGIAGDNLTRNETKALAFMTIIELLNMACILAEAT